MNAVLELEEAYNRYKDDPEFNRELTDLLNNYAGPYSVVLATLERSAVRFGFRREPQKDSCKAAQGKCSFLWDGIWLSARPQFHTKGSPEKHRR